MASIAQFHPPPDDNESEKASNSYLMSLVAIMVGLPLPVVNLVATGIFFFGNRTAGYFVRWHCMQALLAQCIIVVMNGTGLYWTLSIVFRDATVTDPYLGYLLTVILFNLVEFIATVYAAVATRKGRHVELWVFGPLTNLLVRA